MRGKGILLALLWLGGGFGMGCSSNLQGQPEGREAAPGRALITLQDSFYAVSAPHRDHAWVVGYRGQILHTADGGERWEAQPSGTRAPLFSVSFPDLHQGIITGRGGLILRTEDGGRGWQAVSPAVTRHSLLSVTHADPPNVWAVGEAGSIFHSPDGGKTWEDHSLKTWTDPSQLDIYGTDVILNRVLFTDSQNGWIVGEFGKIFHTTDGGRSWTWMANVSGVDRNWIYLYDIGFTDSQNGWIVGAGGVMLRSQDGGKHWQAVESGTDSTLYSLSLIHGTEGAPLGLAVGTRGTLLRSQPVEERWGEVKDLALYNWLRWLAFSDHQHGWIVGGKGTILRTNDGGRHFRLVGRSR
ncbi:MAG: hypothetical protein HYY20_08625 [Candidatus Tectomicrobia bacterium]|uniref:Photosynthesis system II assembly factor Ycf48/Hcf136-like domain-containing protein n=1 Tax=Tectimicrobiota bacterium TaxID=2528274 RepID=A0A932CPI0_UNCTE|nr:hypothetical protein [Candidatus Tectomicrobia bacterium]